MSYQISAYSDFVGKKTGAFKDDLTDVKVGNWPAKQNIKKISRIQVKTGDIVDSITVSYDSVDKNAPIADQKHGGDGGSITLDKILDKDSYLIGVFGRYLTGSTVYGPNVLVELSFVIADISSSKPNISVESTKAGNTGASDTFQQIGKLIAFASYSEKPTGRPTEYLQALSLAKVLAQTG